jgi:hypothetical protein
VIPKIAFDPLVFIHCIVRGSAATMGSELVLRHEQPQSSMEGNRLNRILRQKIIKDLLLKLYLELVIGVF